MMNIQHEAVVEKAVPTQELRAIERVAVELAHLAGAEIVLTLGQILEVRYKTGSDSDDTLRDPVSEVDRRIERLIRERLSQRYPDHIVIGEEFDMPGSQESDFTWAIDPVDGTANFINGFPLFAAAIGVLHRGRPVVGAQWCATSHALRAGVYHGHRGGVLKFDGSAVVPIHNPAIRRRLAGVPHTSTQRGAWETRKTGSAAIECAFAAAGLLEAALFKTPNLWDVAGGLALVQAAGGEVLTWDGASWIAFDRFEAPVFDGKPNLRRWNQPIIVGRIGAQALIEGLSHIEM